MNPIVCQFSTSQGTLTVQQVHRRASEARRSIHPPGWVGSQSLEVLLNIRPFFFALMNWFFFCSNQPPKIPLITSDLASELSQLKCLAPLSYPEPIFPFYICLITEQGLG